MRRTAIMKYSFHLSVYLVILKIFGVVVCSSNNEFSGINMGMNNRESSSHGVVPTEGTLYYNEKADDANDYVDDYLINPPTVEDLMNIPISQLYNSNIPGVPFNVESYLQRRLNTVKITDNQMPTTSSQMYNTERLEIDRNNPNPTNTEGCALIIKKRKAAEDTEELKCTERSTDTRSFSILYMVRDSKEYGIFINFLHGYKLAMAKTRKSDEQSAPVFFNPEVNIQDIYPKLMDNINNAADESKCIWHGLYSIKQEKNVRTKLAFIKHISMESYKVDQMFKNYNNLYSYELIFNLNKYLTKECPSCYNISLMELTKEKLIPFNFNEITIGDIYLKREISLPWHAESLLISYINKTLQTSFDVLEENLDDLQLKRRLILILCIPEIYEDLFYMKYEEISRVKNRILAISPNRVVKAQCSLFCIIEYLHGNVHNKNNIMEESYKKLQEATAPYSLLYKHSEIDIYKLVYKAFSYFYKYSLYLYEVDTDYRMNNGHLTEKQKISYAAMKKYIKIPENNIIPYQGKGVVIMHNYSRCIVRFQYAGVKTQNERLLDSIVDKQVRYNYKFKETINISHYYHYHVQVVDNSAHRVHIIHLPFFVSNGTGTIKYNYIHTLEDIVDHIKKTLYTKVQTHQQINAGVYPFKYNRAEKTWSLVTKPNNTKVKRKKLEVTENEMNKTMEEMHNSGFDVVFYYIKENIKTTEFVFAQFNPIDGMVINKAYEESKEEAKKLFDGCMINRTAPRIPLFLPKLMTSAIHMGPYVLKSEMYESKSLGDYQNLVPVEFSNWLDHLANKNTSNQKKIIELINQNKHEIYYYSDFVILSINQPYEDCDCYGMETVQTNYKFGMIEIEWYAKKSYDIGEYTNYELDLTYRNTNYNMCNVMERSKPEVLYSFLEMLQRKHVSQDMAYYSVFIYTLKDTNKTNTIPLFCSELKEHMNNLLSGDSEMDNIINPIFKENGKKFKDYLNEKMPSVYDISKVHISVKNVNYTKSKLGLNYNILNIFF